MIVPGFFHNKSNGLQKINRQFHTTQKHKRRSNPRRDGTHQSSHQSGRSRPSPTILFSPRRQPLPLASSSPKPKTLVELGDSARTDRNAGGAEFRRPVDAVAGPFPGRAAAFQPHLIPQRVPYGRLCLPRLRAPLRTPSLPSARLPALAASFFFSSFCFSSWFGIGDLG